MDLYAFALTTISPPIILKVAVKTFIHKSCRNIIILKVDVGHVVLGGEEHAAAVVLHKLRVLNIFFRESKKSPNNMNGVWCFVNL